MPKSSALNLSHTLLARGFIYEARRRRGDYPARRLLGKRLQRERRAIAQEIAYLGELSPFKDCD